jgi:hypothetical protein
MRTWMILPLLLSAVPLTPTLAAAAQPTRSQSPQQFRFPPDRMACPVSLRVDRRAEVISREIDGKAIPTGQGLMLHFGSPFIPSTAGAASDGTTKSKTTVISADITVHGYAGGVVEQPLTIRSSSELTEDFHLTGSATAPLTEKSVWTTKMHGITWIELTRATFSDGSSWQSSVPKECVVEPSLFVLVK